MKIVHVYAKNLEIFTEAVNGTECRLNASSDIKYLLNTIQSYNARDVLGLIVFANPFTKKCVKLIRQFDKMFVFKKLPIVVINDNVDELESAGYLKVRHSELYTIKSEDNSISDVEINAIFTTLLAYSSVLYDLSNCSRENTGSRVKVVESADDLEMSSQLQSLFKYIEGRDFCADSS